jgi:hypothetical protein
LKKESAFKYRFIPVKGPQNMPGYAEAEKIPLLDFIVHNESRAIEILKNCIKKNNQFSTIFVIQQYISGLERQLKKLRKDESVTTKVRVPAAWIGESDWSAVQARVAGEYDLENLNFLEATQLVTSITEYLVAGYQAAENKTSEKVIKHVLHKAVERKTDQLKKLKKEYLRLRTQS